MKSVICLSCRDTSTSSIFAFQ
uniref:Uncharacterized protein n=1 Tax=Arundo donax TaxID=35708 RepID=A0A0A9FHF2_ARUDO